MSDAPAIMPPETRASALPAGVELEEYTSLRDEILLRINLRQQLSRV